jgi:hypothetical protein
MWIPLVLKGDGQPLTATAILPAEEPPGLIDTLDQTVKAALEEVGAFFSAVGDWIFGSSQENP